MIVKTGSFAALALLALSASALADDTTQSSTTTVEAAAPSLADHIALSYWCNWHGPSVGQPNSYVPNWNSDTPSVSNNNGGTTNGTLFGENVITAGYKFTPDRSVTFNLDVLSPFARGDAPVLANSYVSLRDKKFIKSGPWTQDVALRMYVPTASSYQKNGMIVAPALVDQISYDTGDWTFAAWNRARVYTYSNAPDGALQWTVDIAPNANWQFSKTVAATMWIDMIQLYQKKGGDVTNMFADVEPGINWDVTPNISLNPYLNIYPNSMTATATSINLLITAKAL
jgi:hypothetical protein